MQVQHNVGFMSYLNEKMLYHNSVVVTQIFHVKLVGNNMQLLSQLASMQSYNVLVAC